MDAQLSRSDHPVIDQRVDCVTVREEPKFDPSSVSVHFRVFSLQGSFRAEDEAA